MIAAFHSPTAAEPGPADIETVKAMYEALGRGEVDAILALGTEDLDWSTDGGRPRCRACVDGEDGSREVGVKGSV